MKFSIKDFFSKCDQIPQKSEEILKKSLMENSIFCVVNGSELVMGQFQKKKCWKQRFCAQNLKQL